MATQTPMTPKTISMIASFESFVIAACVKDHKGSKIEKLRRMNWNWGLIRQTSAHLKIGRIYRDVYYERMKCEMIKKS